MKSTKKALLLSITSMLLCVAMLMGTTFAWFTDSVTSGKNRIVAGNLDVELTHTNSAVTDEKVQDSTNLFKVEKVGENIKDVLWEPGMVVYENFTVKNVGTLALKYQFKLNTFKYNSYNGHDLTEILKVAVVENGFNGDRAAAQALTNYVPLSDFALAGNGWLEAGASSAPFGVVIYWEPGDNDNLYNVNNYTGTRPTSDGEPLFVEFGVDLIATQKDYESDSFGNDYDITAADFAETSVVPVVKPLIVPVDPDPAKLRIVRAPEENETLTLKVANQDMTVTYTVGTKLTSETAIASDKKTADAKLGFEFKSETSNMNVTVGENQKLANYELTLNIAQDNNVLNKVTKLLPKDLVNVVAYHNSATAMAKLAEETTVPTEKESYFYNPSTGILTIWVFHASEVDVTYDLPEIEILKDGKHVGNSTLILFRDAVNAGNTYEGYEIKQLKDIDLGGQGHTWTSIGYPNTGSYVATRPFKGTYNGNGCTISNLYRHCYDAGDIGDHTGGGLAGPYGLFGCVEDATIKNLTIDGAVLATEEGNRDTTFTTGAFVATAFGNSTFENLTAKNVNITGYIDSCGIIVGGVTQGNFMFKNINVDASNEVNTHDWGVWSSCDCHMGGIIGTIDVQDSESPKLKTSHVTIEDSTVAAKIMQMNDVMSNYAWYQYRCSGMLVGGFTINHTDGLWNNCDDISDTRLADALTCKNVTVIYDMWNHQYYCTAGEHIAGKTYSGDHVGRKPAEGHCDGCNGDDLIVFDQLVGGWAGGTWKYEAGQTYKALEGVTVKYLNDSKPDGTAN